MFTRPRDETTGKDFGTWRRRHPSAAWEPRPAGLQGSAGCRAAGPTVGGLGRRAQEQLEEANGEKFTRYETWQNKLGEETLRICTEVHAALAVELFK